MDIREFFELFEGQWVSQRTLHHIQTEQTDANKADLWIETLDLTAPKVVDACAEFNLSAEQAVCPMEITYKATLANGQTQTATTLMVPVKTSEHGGQLISVPQAGSAVLGRFEFGADEVMTFYSTAGADEVVERIWYASENLRLRSITQLSDQKGASEANFCSEVRRMGAAQPNPTAEQSQQPLTGLAAWRARQGNMT
ncbi:MAG: phycobiliprotein lyase [Cyanobacteria bacterium P01_F01_bin.42]